MGTLRVRIYYTQVRACGQLICAYIDIEFTDVLHGIPVANGPYSGSNCNGLIPPWDLHVLAQYFLSG